MSDPSSSLSAVPGVVPVSSVAGTTPATTVTDPPKGTTMNLLTNRTFQVFLFSLVSVAAITVLMSLGVVSESQGFPFLTALVGFMVGVPVTTSNP